MAIKYDAVDREDRVGPALKLKPREAYTYALGEIGSNLSWNMVSGFILFYYSNVAHIPIAVAGTLLLATRILDAVVDPVIGLGVDKTRTPLGKARPWILIGIIPFAALTCMTFSIPNISGQLRILYAFATFTLAGMLFSAIYVPYNALLPLMTSDHEDKLKIGSLRAVAASVGSIVVFGVMMPLVGWLGRGDAQRGFTGTSALMAICTAVIMSMVALLCRERVQPNLATAAAAQPIAASLRTMIVNPIWLIGAGFAFTMFVRLGVLVSVTAYYATYVLLRPDMIGLLLSALSFAILVGGLISKPWLSYFGKKRGNQIALGVSIVLSLVMATLHQIIGVFVVCYFISSVPLGVQSATVFAMSADAVDHQERMCGHRSEGLLTSTISFAMKVGIAVGAAITAYGLAIAAYRADAVTAQARGAISILYLYFPALLAGLQFAAISILPEASDPRQFGLTRRSI